MDVLQFLQTGGWPLKADRLQELQGALSIMQSFGYLAGNFSIISGCEKVGTSTTNGVVFFNGELFNFVGGVTGTNVKIIEQIISKEFKNGELKPVIIKRHVTFASGLGSVTWASFKKPMSILELQSRILPPKTNPQIYTGLVANIPAGWQLCDGTNGTPNLKGMFLVGYNPTDTDYSEIGKTGGSKQVQLSEPHMPAHYHVGTTIASGEHKHTGMVLKGSNSDNGDAGQYVITSGAEPNGNQPNSGETSWAGNHSHNFNTDMTGGSQPHENRPPYYTVAYIMYTGL